MKGEELGGHEGVPVELGRKVLDGWEVFTRGERACKVPTKAPFPPREGEDLGWMQHGPSNNLTS